MAQNLVGHQHQREHLQRLMQSAHLPHAIMLAGRSGIGKSLVGRELARSLLCEQPDNSRACENCKSCALVDSESHPDFITLHCSDREQRKVERMRQLLYNLNLKAYGGKRRVVLLDDAEYLLTQAVNVLLKSLEEPRPNTHFVLICANPSRLPETLLSRCQVWHFAELSSQEIETVLQQVQTSSDDKEVTEALRNISASEAAILLDGSLENLKGISEQRERWSEINADMQQVCSADLHSAFKLVRDISQTKEKLPAALQLLRCFARQKMLSSDEAVEQRIWALLINDLTEAERLIFESNIQAQYALNAVMVGLINNLRHKAFTRISNSAILLEDTVRM